MLFRMMYDCMPVGLGVRGAFERPTATASPEQGAAAGERLLWLCLPRIKIFYYLMMRVCLLLPWESEAGTGRSKALFKEDARGRCLTKTGTLCLSSAAPRSWSLLVPVPALFLRLALQKRETQTVRIRARASDLVLASSPGLLTVRHLLF